MIDDQEVLLHYGLGVRSRPLFLIPSPILGGTARCTFYRLHDSIASFAHKLDAMVCVCTKAWRKSSPIYVPAEIIRSEA
jgi:hypothetical protein